MSSKVRHTRCAAKHSFSLTSVWRLTRAQSTGAYYTFVVNQVSGLIFALDILSPSHAIGMHWKSLGGTATPEDLPKLQYGSDLIWGKWVHGNPDVKNLRVYAVYSVLNDETTALVSRALRNKGVDGLTTWPGAVFVKEQDEVEFQALIGKSTSSW